MRITIVKLQLEEQNKLLLRIAEALERLSPVIPARPLPRKAQLSDLLQVDPVIVRITAEAEDELARLTNTVPRSEAFDKAKAEFEETVRKTQGEDAVRGLPWNRLHR